MTHDVELTTSFQPIESYRHLKELRLAFQYHVLQFTACTANIYSRESLKDWPFKINLKFSQKNSSSLGSIHKIFVVIDVVVVVVVVVVVAVVVVIFFVV